MKERLVEVWEDLALPLLTFAFLTGVFLFWADRVGLNFPYPETLYGLLIFTAALVASWGAEWFGRWKDNRICRATSMICGAVAAVSGAIIGIGLVVLLVWSYSVDSGPPPACQRFCD